MLGNRAVRQSATLNWCDLRRTRTLVRSRSGWSSFCPLSLVSRIGRIRQHDAKSAMQASFVAQVLDGIARLRDQPDPSISRDR